MTAQDYSEPISRTSNEHRTNSEGVEPERSPDSPIGVVRSNVKLVDGVVINEYLTRNVSTVKDPAGENDPWIELYNNSSEEIDLSGWHLVYDAVTTTQWTFPNGTTIPGNGYLIVWADNDEGQTGLHTNFVLGESGKTILLLQPDLSRADSVNYQSNNNQDQSRVRIPNGKGSFASLPMYPTFGENNQNRDPGSHSINEIVVVNVEGPPDQDGEFDSWIELYSNAGTIDLSDFYLSTDATDLHRWRFPRGTKIPAKGYLIVWVDGDTTQTGLHTNFTLEETGGTLILTLADFFVWGFVEYGDLSGGGAYARVPDGTGPYVVQRPTYSLNNETRLPSQVVINELVASNTNGSTDQGGEFDDWIELYNNSSNAIDLSGWHLSDDAAQPTKWEFPNGTTIPGHGYLIVWADEDGGQTGLHTNFTLDEAGETLYLYEPDMYLTDSVAFRALVPNVAYARVPNGKGRFVIQEPTFMENNGTEQIGKVVINEMLARNQTVVTDPSGEYDPWIELYNNFDKPRDLSGWYLTDSKSNLTRWKFPEGTTIAGNDYLIIWVDGDEGQEGLHTNFTMPASPKLFLVEQDLYITDSLSPTSTSADIANGRVPNGTGGFARLTPTFNRNNQDHPAGLFGINELVVLNSESSVDQDGEYDSWVELYNSTSSSISLNNYYLGTDGNNMTQWKFPSGVTIPANGYLIIWIDGDSTQKGLHTNFTLDGSGGTLVLASLGTLASDFIEFAQQSEDVALARTPDSKGNFAFREPTFNANNDIPPPSKVVINELLASNKESAADPEGEYDDWIELYNKSNKAYDISGWYLSDDGNKLTQWQFPNGTVIPAGSYLIVWGDDDEGQTGLHANFTLSLSGETLFLVRPNEFVADSVEFGAQSTDIAYARYPNGTGSFILQWPTFNQNNETPTLSKVVINELLASNTKSKADQDGEFDDWIELYNKSSVDISLDGWYLSDDEADKTQWKFPDGITIPANGYLTVWADDDGGQAGLHANFTLALAGETLFLIDPNLRVADSVTFGAQSADVAFARVPNGTGNFVLRQPTFNRDNEDLSTVEILLSENRTLQLYPNPVRGALHLHSQSTAITTVELVNIIGVSVAEIAFRGEATLDVRDFPAGVYFVRSGNTIHQIFIQ
ncbi:MAG: lamin tail domain-containing protein [Ignavibacteriae bacterium]|nr:lamin tail domain-containing protein [Ignavibacteriota bacterium]MCB9215632.1 lamin tail domain-containing protein [Ignavibacteria bacterium]